MINAQQQDVFRRKQAEAADHARRSVPSGDRAALDGAGHNGIAREMRGLRCELEEAKVELDEKRLELRETGIALRKRDVDFKKAAHKLLEMAEMDSRYRTLEEQRRGRMDRLVKLVGSLEKEEGLKLKLAEVCKEIVDIDERIGACARAVDAILGAPPAGARSTDGDIAAAGSETRADGATQEEGDAPSQSKLAQRPARLQVQHADPQAQDVNTPLPARTKKFSMEERDGHGGQLSHPHAEHARGVDGYAVRPTEGTARTPMSIGEAIEKIFNNSSDVADRAPKSQGPPGDKRHSDWAETRGRADALARSLGLSSEGVTPTLVSPLGDEQSGINPPQQAAASEVYSSSVPNGMHYNTAAGVKNAAADTMSPLPVQQHDTVMELPTNDLRQGKRSAPQDAEEEGEAKKVRKVLEENDFMHAEHVLLTNVGNALIMSLQRDIVAVGGMEGCGYESIALAAMDLGLAPRERYHTSGVLERVGRSMLRDALNRTEVCTVFEPNYLEELRVASAGPGPRSDGLFRLGMLKALAIYWRRPIFMVVIDTGARKFPINVREDPDAQPGEMQIRLPMLWVFTQTDDLPYSINAVNNFDARPFSREIIGEDDVVLYRTRLNAGPWIDHVRPCIRMSIREMVRSTQKLNVILESCSFAGEHWKVKRGRADRNSSAARLSGVFKLLAKKPNQAFLAALLLMGSERTDYLLDAVGLQKRRDYIAARARGRSEKLLMLGQHDSERLVDYLSQFHREIFTKLTRSRDGQETRERVRHIIQDPRLAMVQKKRTIAEVMDCFFKGMSSVPVTHAPDDDAQPTLILHLTNPINHRGSDQESAAAVGGVSLNASQEIGAAEAQAAGDAAHDGHTEGTANHQSGGSDSNDPQDGLTKLLQAAATGGDDRDKRSNKRPANRKTTTV